MTSHGSTAVQAVALVVLCWSCAGHERQANTAKQQLQHSLYANCKSLRSLDECRRLHSIRNLGVFDELWHSCFSLKALATLFLALNPTAAWQILSAGTSHRLAASPAVDMHARAGLPLPPRRLVRVPSRATASCMDAIAWQTSGGTELNMIPFSVKEALLPGDTKQVHLFEARFVRLFLDAIQRHNKSVGQLLITANNDIAAYTSLLVIEESKIEDIGVWARLRCVGRVRVKDVETTDYGYWRAKVGLVTDALSQPASEALIEECVKAHSRCRELNRKLERIRLGEDKSRIKEMLNDLNVPEEKVLMGHERSKNVEFDKDLKKLCNTRRDQLRLHGLNATSVNATLVNTTSAEGLGKPLQRLWGASTEMEAEQQLLGFTAAAFLPPIARIQILQTTNATKRLEMIVEFLEEQEKRIAAELALAQLGNLSEPKKEE